MTLESLGDSAAGLLARLLSLELRSTLVIALALLVGLFARRWQASTRHALWLWACAALVAIPVLGAVLPAVTVPLATTSLAKAGAWLIPTAAFEERASATPVQSASAPTLPWQACIIVVWFAGSAALLARLAWAHVRALQAQQGASEDSDVEWRHACANAARQWGLKREPRLLVTDAFDGPVTVGLLRPAILRPATDPKLAASSAMVRGAIAAHEVAHVARRDGWSQLFANVVRALHWPNPLAWWLARAVRLEAERACDDAVLAQGVAPSWYAEQLLQVAQRSNGRESVSIAVLGVWGRALLEHRIRYLLSPHPRQVPSRRALALIVAIALPTMALASKPPVRTVLNRGNHPQRTTVTIAPDGIYLLPIGTAESGAPLPGDRVVELNRMDVQGDATDSRLILPLANRLRANATTASAPASASATCDASVDIRAAGATPYGLLLRVLHTAGECGYDRPSLVVHTPSGERTIPLHDPGSATGVEVTVAIMRNGFGVVASAEPASSRYGPYFNGEPLVPKKADGSYDVGSLRALLVDVKQAFPWETKVVVAAQEDTPYEVLGQTIDAVRESNEHQVLFPDVVLGMF